MPLKVLIHGINFSPELVGVGKYTGEMAEWLADRGHDVRVVTAPPFNPDWKVFAGYSAYRYKKEFSSERFRGKLVVFRCPVWVSPQHSGTKRLLHLLSFAVSSVPIVLSQIVWKPDVVIVVEPTLFCAPAAWLAGRLSGSKTWLHIQDFEIDAAFELGMLNSTAARRFVGWFEKICIAGFDRVSTISEKMLSGLKKKGVSSTTCVLFPNWVDSRAIFPLAKPSPLRREFGIPETDIVALYSGNMGAKQGLELLAETARRLQKRKGLWFVFCGAGPGKQRLIELASQLPNVLFSPLQPVERLNFLLNLADIHLLPQRLGAADLVMPSKLTGMLASGRPVIATASDGTQLAHAVHGKGLVIAPEDPSAMAAAVIKLTEDTALRKDLGDNARSYAVSELDKNKVLSRFEDHLHQCTKTGLIAVEGLT